MRPRWPAPTTASFKRASRGSPAFAGPAVFAFLLRLNEAQQFVHLRHQLIVAAQNLAGVIETRPWPDRAADGLRPGS